MTELERIMEAEARIGALEKRLESSELRNAKQLESFSLELKLILNRFKDSSLNASGDRNND